MKELSIKEKANAYDKAIKKAKQWRNAPNVDKIPTFGNRIIEEIFPELKESDDERIRNALIGFHKSTIDIDGIKGEDIIAWLEKQGEQKTKSHVERRGLQKPPFNIF